MQPPINDRLQLSERAASLLAALTFDEKVELVTGADVWSTRANARLGIPSMTVTDGPNGARGGGLMGTGTPTACIPAGSVLGATWDPELCRQLGELLGDETRAKGCHVLLAPTINLHRNMLGGRNFECLSEDPLLTGLLAAELIAGVQSKGVATTPKHFVGNDSEFERNTIDVQIDERTLREVYLVPFEHAVKDGGTWGLMGSYNRLNGTFAAEHHWLLTSVLRDEWGFDGLVVSDWFALRSTAPSVRGGTSLEMPGPGIYYGDKLLAARAAGDLSETDLDGAVADVLRLAERTGAFEGLGGEDEKSLDRPQDRALARRAASAGTVLLRNNGVLPLQTDSISSLAVIGPNAINAKIMGGGSATVRAYRKTSPLDALQDRLGSSVDISFAPGCDIDRSVRAIGAPILDGSMTVEFFNGHVLATDNNNISVSRNSMENDTETGEPVATTSVDSASLVFFGEPAAGVNPKAYSARAAGSFTTEVTGLHLFSMVQSGRARVLVDGEVIIDGTVGDFGKSEEFFSMASDEITAELHFEANTTHELVIEYSSRDGVLLLGCRLGVVTKSERDLLGEAEQLAASADAAVVVVGTNDDWETEGRDRDLFALPGDQPELIRRVAAANPNTVVVLNTGGPHQLDWLDDPAAVLSVGFGGQEMGDALVDVLIGEADPGGRMNTTIPAVLEQSPSFLNYPGENSVVRYGENLFIGHRWYDARRLEPAVPFGFGLSYASFEWTAPRVSGGTTTKVESPVIVEVDVTNTSNRSGSEVVQLYVEPSPAILQRPVRELKGFAKVHLEAGQTVTARIELDRRAFAYYDVGDQFFDNAPFAGPVPAAGQARHTEPGWYVEPGSYQLVVARSSVDHVAVVNHELTGDEFRFGA